MLSPSFPAVAAYLQQTWRAGGGPRGEQPVADRFKPYPAQHKSSSAQLPRTGSGRLAAQCNHCASPAAKACSHPATAPPPPPPPPCLRLPQLRRRRPAGRRSRGQPASCRRWQRAALPAGWTHQWWRWRVPVGVSRVGAGGRAQVLAEESAGALFAAPPGRPKDETLPQQQPRVSARATWPGTAATSRQGRPCSNLPHHANTSLPAPAHPRSSQCSPMHLTSALSLDEAHMRCRCSTERMAP